MNFSEVANTIMKSNGIRKVFVAEQLGIAKATMSDFVNVRRRKGVCLNQAIRLFDACGYKVVVVPKHKTITGESYDLDVSDE